MEASEKTVSTKRRRARRQKSARTYEHFFRSLSPGSTFGPGDPRFDAAPYRHTETLAWTGRIILPEGFKYPRAVVTLSAQQGLLSRDAAQKPIGSNYARNGVLNAHVFVPAEHMGQLIGLAASGRLREISFVGEPLYRGRGLIRSISLATETEESELALP